MQICKTHNVSFSSIIHNRDCLAVLAKATPLIMTPIHPSFAKIDFLISSFRQIPIKNKYLIYFPILTGANTVTWKPTHPMHAGNECLCTISE